MIKRGAEPDVERAARWFIKWWRDSGGLAAAPPSTMTPEIGGNDPIMEAWGFDFQWTVTPEETKSAPSRQALVQAKMEECIDNHLAKLEQEEDGENNLSITQKRKQAMIEVKAKRKEKHLAKGKAAGKKPVRRK